MVINKQLNFSRLPLLAAAAVLFLAILPILMVGHASAATFTQAFVRFDRIQALTATTGRVCAKPDATTTSNTEATVKVTFPTTSGTNYALATFASGLWTVNTSNLDTGQTAWPGILAATAVSGQTVTFPSGDLSAGTLYCFNFGDATHVPLTTSSAGATETTQGDISTFTSTPTLIEKTVYSESIVSSDQVAVSGIVPPSFSFALSGTTDSFTTNLTPATVVSTTGRTITLITNAASGWIVWAQDAQNNGSGQGSLHSTIASHYIADVNGNAPGVASAALNTSSENYGLGVTVTTNGSGSAAADAAYDGTTNKAGSLDPTRFRPIASAGGVTNSDIITVTERANSLATTPAASDYSDTITFVGAGRF